MTLVLPVGRTPAAAAAGESPDNPGRQGSPLSPAPHQKDESQMDVTDALSQTASPQAHVTHGEPQTAEGLRGELLIVSCRSGSYLADRVVQRLRELQARRGADDEIVYLRNVDRQFSDGETCARLDTHVGGQDAFLLQSLFDPTAKRTVDENYVAFLIAARALREHGAGHVTAVLPYLAYGRQDKPTPFMREPTTAKLMADLTMTAGVDRLVTWAPHTGQIRGFYGSMPVTMLEPLTLLINEFRCYSRCESVIAVAPDAGASKLVTTFGQALGLSCAIAAKRRPRPEEAVVDEVIGDFRGKKTAIVLDDMVSGGGTVSSVVRTLVRKKGIEEVHLAVSHNLCLGQAHHRLVALHQKYNLVSFVATNSIPQTDRFQRLQFFSWRCLSDMLSETIDRIHRNLSVSEAFYRPHTGTPRERS